MGRGSGFGKVILFGEHFVIYGAPGIVSAIDLTTEVEARRSPDGSLTIHDHRRGTPGYIEAKREQQRESVSRILKTLHPSVAPSASSGQARRRSSGFVPRLSPRGQGSGHGLITEAVEIWLRGSLPVYSGIGASAASCVAIIRALSDEFGLELSDEEVNAAAYEGEKAYHGPTHAGLDNAAATYGGLLWFFKGPPVFHEPMQVEKPFEVVIANTGIVANTHEMIADVARRKAAHPARYARIIQEAHAVATEARVSLEKGDLKAVGRLMDQNHALLQSIEVTCPELDTLVEVARRAGAFGAKSTGAGGGGCMVALTPGAELQERVALAIEREGFEVLRPLVLSPSTSSGRRLSK